MLIVFWTFFIILTAILIFRIFRNTHKRTLKLIHATINATALVLVLLGLIAVIVNHNQGGMANFYSLHSWVGILAIGTYVIQVS